MPAKCGSSPRAKVGIDRSVRLSAPGSPMSRAQRCSRRQPSSGRRPSASSAFQPCVSAFEKSGWWRPPALARGRQAGAPGRARVDGSVHATSPCPWASRGAADRRPGGVRRTRPDDLGGRGRALGAVRIEADVVGDRRPVGGGELRIVPHLVEDEHPRAEREGLADVVGDHQRRSCGAPPRSRRGARASRPGCPDRGPRRARREAAPAAGRGAPARSRAAAACRPRRRRDRGRGHGRARRAPASHRPRRARAAGRAPKRRPVRGASRSSATTRRLCEGREVREGGIALEHDAAFRHRLGRQRAPAEGHRSGGRLLLA